MRRSPVDPECPTDLAIARNKATAREPLNLQYCPTSPNAEGCRCVVSTDDDLFDGDS